jgi:O-glycosyl hydrolase
MTFTVRPSFRKSSLFCTALVCMVAAGSAQYGRTPAISITLDGTSPGARFDGLGAVSAGASSRLLIDYPEPQRSQILDYLFKPGYGAALQHLKVEVGADVNSTDGSEPSHMRTRDDHDYTRGYEWWLMKEARRRNPEIVLDVLPWGAPGWVGGGLLYSPDMANYMADFIEGAAKQNLDISYAGIWNEKVYDAAYVKELHQALVARHLKTKIVCCDEYVGQGKGQWEIADAIKADPQLGEIVDVIGVHYPLEKGRVTTTASARASGKPLWSSEDQPNNGSGPYVSRDWPIGGRILAHLYNQNYLEGGLTATEIWSPVTSYYDLLAAPNSGLMYANTPWSGNYQVQGTIWATAHTTQFTKPGWRYLDRSSGLLPEKGSYVTLRSPDAQQWSVVLETIGAQSPLKASFKIVSGLPGNIVHIWETNDQKIFEHVDDVKVKDGAFSYTFDPNSLYTLTTTTGQGRGAAKPPPAAEFPNNYSENFERTTLNRAPRYLADQDGAFEVHLCKDRQGRCLEQMITEKPTPWGPLPDPFTLAGSLKAEDYEVVSDFRLDKGTAAIMGRIDSADVFLDSAALLPSAYVLTVGEAGDWKLLSSAYKKPPITLASGTVKLSSSSWHHFTLVMRGQRISARLDGVQLASVQDASHSHGLFGIGCSWNRVQFDNLKTTLVP